MNKKMRVLILGNSINLSGGAHAAFLDHVKVLQADDTYIVEKKSLESFGVSPADVNVYQNLDFVSKVFRTPAYLFNVRIFFGLLFSCLKFRPHIVHLHLYIGGLTVAAVVAAKLCGAKVCHTVHDYRSICARNAMLDLNGDICDACVTSPEAILRINCTGYSKSANLVLFFESRLRQMVQRVFRVDWYIFVSHFAQQKHIEAEIPISNYSVNYNYVKRELNNNQTETTSLASSRIARIGIPTIAYIGRLSLEKGIVELCREFVKSSLECRILIIGDGPERECLKELCSQDERVCFVGHVERSEIYNMLRDWIDAVILPSAWYENNPLSLIEAQMLGVPAIAANIGGIPEIITHETNGLLFKRFDYKNAIKMLDVFLNMSVEERSHMETECKKNYEVRFTEHVFIGGLKSVYASLVDC